MWIAVSWWQGEKWTVCLYIRKSSVIKKILCEKKNERKKPATLDPFISRSLSRTQTSLPPDRERASPNLILFNSVLTCVVGSC